MKRTNVSFWRVTWQRLGQLLENFLVESDGLFGMHQSLAQLGKGQKDLDRSLFAWNAFQLDQKRIISKD